MRIQSRNVRTSMLAQSKFSSIRCSTHFPKQKKTIQEWPFRTTFPFDSVKKQSKIYFWYASTKTKKQHSCETSSSSSSSSNSSSSFSSSFRYSSPFWVHEQNCTKSFQFVAWNLVLDCDLAIYFLKIKTNNNNNNYYSYNNYNNLQQHARKQEQTTKYVLTFYLLFFNCFHFVTNMNFFQ